MPTEVKWMHAANKRPQQRSDEKETKRSKELRLETEFGDGNVVDPCDDGGFWLGPTAQSWVSDSTAG